jgi:hypothetical protein
MKAQVSDLGLRLVAAGVTGDVYRVAIGRRVDQRTRGRAAGRRLPGSGGDEGGELFGSGRAHAGQQVLVGVHRERRVRVAETLAHHLDRHADGDEQRRVRVAQIVEADAWQLGASDGALEELTDRLGG